MADRQRTVEAETNATTRVNPSSWQRPGIDSQRNACRMLSSCTAVVNSCKSRQRIDRTAGSGLTGISRPGVHHPAQLRAKRASARHLRTPNTARAATCLSHTVMVADFCRTQRHILAVSPRARRRTQACVLHLRKQDMISTRLAARRLWSLVDQSINPGQIRGAERGAVMFLSKRNNSCRNAKRACTDAALSYRRPSGGCRWASWKLTVPIAQSKITSLLLQCRQRRPCNT